MTRTIEAIYANGVLRPVEDLQLQEQQRVRVTVETLDPDSDDEDRGRARQRLIERLRHSALSYGGILPSREELHSHDRGL